jgi:hypothetical protein
MLSNSTSDARQALGDRAQEIRAEVDNARQQGLEPIAEYFSIAGRYVSGELTLEQFSAAVNDLCPRSPAPRRARSRAAHS